VIHDKHLADAVKFTEKLGYKKLTELGSGTFSRVHLCKRTDEEENKLVAIKYSLHSKLKIHNKIETLLQKISVSLSGTRKPVPRHALVSLQARSPCF